MNPEEFKEFMDLQVKEILAYKEDNCTRDDQSEMDLVYEWIQNYAEEFRKEWMLQRHAQYCK